MYIDVSIPIEDEMVVFPGDPGIKVRKDQTIEENGVNVSRMTVGLHSGTHVDSPAHFIKDAKTVDEISPDRFFGKCRVFDLTELNAKYIDAKDIAKLDIDCEAVFFKTANSILLLKKEFDPYFVYITEAAASLLVRKGVKVLGFDYLTIDKLASDLAHQALLGAGVVIYETVNLINVKAGLYEYYGMPLRIKGAEASPVRVILRKIDEKN